MSAPDYLAFLRKMGDPNTGPPIAAVCASVANHLHSGAHVERLSGGSEDHGDVNHAIDAQVDRLVVACDGDLRLACFELATMFGQALEQMLGPRP